MLMTVNEFVNKIKNVLNYKTLYISGCFGAPMSPKNKERYKNNNAYMYIIYYIHFYYVYSVKS